MASGTHTTTSLLPATPRERSGLLGTQQARRSLLPAGPGHALGPVTSAIRAVRAASTIDPWQAAHVDERRALRALHERIAGAVA